MEDHLEELQKPTTKFYPLTRSQLLLWTGQQLSPDSPLYNMAFTFTLEGPLDVPHFQQAFQGLVDRTDALRLVFSERDGQPRQQILERYPYRVEVIDRSDDAQFDYATWATQRSQRILDWSGPLFDSVLIKRGEGHYLWFFNQHHLITDAWAVTVLYEALAKLYRASLEGTLADVPALPSFIDYLEFKQMARTNPKKAHLHEHWKEKLQTLPPPASLHGYPTGRPTSRAQRVRIDLGPERANRLRRLIQEPDLRAWTENMALFNVFVTLLMSYLYRVSGQKNLTIGTPAHNRVKPIFKKTAGVFIELFPLAAQIEAGESFSQLYQRIRTEVNGFLRYAQPGTSTLGLNRSFNVVLNYIHVHFGDFHDLSVNSHWQHPGHCDPGHHLRMQVYDFDHTGNVQLFFDLNEDVFDAELRRHTPAHFLALLDAFLADREQALTAPALLHKSAANRLVQAFNPTFEVSASVPTVVELFDQQVAAQPGAVALQYGPQTLTYAEVRDRAEALARYLHRQGINRGQRVGLYLRRSPELVIGILGVLKAGATYIPIAADAPSSRVIDLVEEADVALLLTGAEFYDGLSDLTIPRFQLGLAELASLNGQPTPSSGHSEGTDLAYIMFTSGSTGRPKGVGISHRALSHYLRWAREKYAIVERPAFPLFTRIGFDLTVTSIYVPLISGGRIVIYDEVTSGPDLALLDVIADNAVDAIKLTPSHLTLLHDQDLAQSRIRVMVVGGEDFKAQLAASIQERFPAGLKIYNEYGPTEATVGCVWHRYEPVDRDKLSVPIGVPAPHMQVYVLNESGQLTPQGVPGELYLAGESLAVGYWNRADLTAERFVDNPFSPGRKMYRTGDLVQWNRAGQLEFLGRIDQQMKIGGIRIEPGEIEAALSSFPGVKQTVVELWDRPNATQHEAEHYCTNCGLPSNYPEAVFDDDGVCNFCHSFESFQRKAEQYFKTLDDLREIFRQARKRRGGDYDCIMLLSGGKDSSYALGQLKEMGFEVLAFTLDNGFISEGAKDNVRRIVSDLGIDHVFGTTPAMNEIFVDSLERHCNVCNGCFKALYTMSVQIAVEKKIPIIVTGLSRGQFFETRLTEELFWKDNVDISGIDDIILNARKEYHRVDDAVSRLMDVSIFDTDEVFEQVQFVDFYRYTDVSLEEMYVYLDSKIPWIRPADTGRSTNCIINKLGIYVHTKEQGYSNYAFPYSWDVRMGHKKRATAIDEINEPIDEQEVRVMMKEIGYIEPRKTIDGQELVAFYVADRDIPTRELWAHMAERLPEYMIPTRFQRLDELPLTPNGKIDRSALPDWEPSKVESNVEYIAPRTQLEEMLTEFWLEILPVEKIGVNDNFLQLGGNSLEAIRLMARVEKAFELDLPIKMVFDHPTIAEFGEAIEAVISELLSDQES